jgi:prepilin signal peptidase PulO-like enzyme (type II secretory pathway)
MDFFCSNTIGVARLALFSCVAISASIEDIRTLRTRRRPLLVLIAFLVVFPDSQWPAFASERALGTGAAFASFMTARFITNNRLGLADVWMACAIGALGGPVFFAQASLSAIVLMLPAKKGGAAPFIPALVAGTFLSVFFSIFFGHD